MPIYLFIALKISTNIIGETDKLNKRIQSLNGSKLKEKNSRIGGTNTTKSKAAKETRQAKNKVGFLGDFLLNIEILFECWLKE